MEALRQPENRLKGFLPSPGGASSAKHRANPHRVGVAAHRHRTRTTGHRVYANDNPVRFTDPDGRESVGEMIDNAAEGCGAVSCAGWAAANALWSVFGAEGVSQVYDKGAGASTGNMVMAGVEVATLGQGGKVGAGIRAVKGTARWFSPAAQVSRRIGKEFGVIGSATKNARGKVFKVAEGKVTVRAMESGGGRTNYLRISVEGKGSVDAAGAFSSDRAATHIPINDDSIKLIQDVIKRYTK